MASRQLILCDSFHCCEFSRVRKAVGDFFRTAGWVQASDSG
jgi:hypothetical protein